MQICTLNKIHKKRIYNIYFYIYVEKTSSKEKTTLVTKSLNISKSIL